MAEARKALPTEYPLSVIVTAAKIIIQFFISRKFTVKIQQKPKSCIRNGIGIIILND